MLSATHTLGARVASHTLPAASPGLPMIDTHLANAINNSPSDMDDRTFPSAFSRKERVITFVVFVSGFHGDLPRAARAFLALFFAQATSDAPIRSLIRRGKAPNGIEHNYAPFLSLCIDFNPPPPPPPHPTSSNLVKHPYLPVPYLYSFLLRV